MKPKNVLVVEDDAILLFVNEKLLSQLGYHVIATAKTGEQAIEEARRTNPDIIMMDIRLIGDMDGIDAMVEIRKFSSVPVVYLSGNSDPRTYQKAQTTDMHAFLVKPVSFEMLKETLSTIGV